MEESADFTLLLTGYRAKKFQDLDSGCWGSDAPSPGRKGKYLQMQLIMAMSAG